jgi:hypothetical protein
VSHPDEWPASGVMHFRLEEPRLGRLDLSCDNGYVISSYDLGFPEVREVAVPNSLDDGTFDITKFYGARSITLDIVLKPHSGISPSSPLLGAESLLRDRLLAFLHPGTRPVLIFSEHDDDRVKQVMVRGSQGTVAVDRKNYNRLSASWVAPRGSLLSWDQRCYQWTFSSNTADTQTQLIVNAGSAPAHWQAMLTGEATKPRFILNGTQLLQLDYNSTPGDTIVIDSFSRTVTIDGVQSGYKYIADNTNWMQVPPGTSRLTIEQDTYSVEGYPYAWWQPGGTGKTPTNWSIPPGTTPANNPPPGGNPPWAWTTRRDPDTGEPGRLEINFCFYDTFV